LANPPLPTALCRLPRGFAVGKAFADWVYAFADRGKQSAKRRFPVVYMTQSTATARGDNIPFVGV
jgi:hypothetical protein